MNKFLACFALMPALASLLTAQQAVSLFLEPSTNGTVYFKEDLEALNKRGPAPYPAGQEVTEWMVVDYPGTYVGYVTPSSIDKDSMTVKEGSKILLRPQAGSNVIATVDGSFKPQVIELGPNWATVFFEGEAPAYFQWPSTQPVAEVETVTVSSAPAEGGEIVEITDETVVAPVTAAPAAKPAAAPVAKPAPVVAAKPAPKPTPAPAASTAPELAPIAATPRQQIYVSPPPPPLTSKQVTRVWEGKLVRNTGLNKLFGKDYPYYLEDASGDRIAYVDLSGALLFQPVEKYWDTQVIIDGTAEKIVDSTPVLIKVRVIRPKLF